MDRSIPLKGLQIQALHQLWREEPVLRGCLNRIMQAVFAGGVTIDGGGHPTPDFEQYLKRYWIPFGCDLVTNFVLFGYCPYIINKKRISSRPRRFIQYPVALPIGTYEVRVDCNSDYEREFKVFQRNYRNQPIDLRTPDKRVKMAFFNYGTKPSIRGDIQTDLASLINTIHNTDEHEEYALRAEAINSNPTLFIQSKSENRAFEEVSHLRAFDNTDVEWARDAKRKRGTLDSYESMIHSANTARAANHGEPPMISSRTGRMFPVHRRLWQNNVFAIPEGTEFSSNVPQPTMRNDIDSLVRHKEDLLCGVVGVPRGLLMGDLSGGNAQTTQSESQNETFRRTVDTHKDAVLRVFHEVYSEMFGQDGESIALPGISVSALEDIYSAYDRGVINADTMGGFVMRSLNTPSAEVDKERLQKFDRHHVKTIMENKVPQDLSKGAVDKTDDPRKKPTKKPNNK